ncbi:MAG: DUF2567 domain-containing protein [Mycobacteriales bacterium]
MSQPEDTAGPEHPKGTVRPEHPEGMVRPEHAEDTQSAPAPAVAPGDGRWRAWPGGFHHLIPRRAEVRDGAVVVLGCLILGLPAGAIWAALAPRLIYQVTKAGTAYELNVESERLFAGDGWFIVAGMAAGLLTGLLSWWLPRRSRGPVLLVIVAVGSLAGSLVAWRFGAFLGRHPTPVEANATLQHVGATLRQRLSLRAKVALLSWPLVTMFFYILHSSFARDSGLGVADAVLHRSRSAAPGATGQSVVTEGPPAAG